MSENERTKQRVDKGKRDVADVVRGSQTEPPRRKELVKVLPVNDTEAELTRVVTEKAS